MVKIKKDDKMHFLSTKYIYFIFIYIKFLQKKLPRILEVFDLGKKGEFREIISSLRNEI